MPTQIDIKVGVFDTPEGPKIFVEPGKDNVSAGKAGTGAVHIEWESRDGGMGIRMRRIPYLSG